MKTKRIYGRVIGVLAALFLMAGCNDLTGPGTGLGESIPDGMGLAHIRLSAGELAQNVRTVLPDFEATYFTLEFIVEGKTTVNKTLSGSMTVTVVLDPVVWNLEVKGYTNSSMGTLKVTGNISVPITAGTEASFDVYLAPNSGSGGTGSHMSLVEPLA